MRTSPPAQNALPAPRSTTARTEGSGSHSSSFRWNARIMSSVSAFSAFSRSSVATPRLPRRSKRIESVTAASEDRVLAIRPPELLETLDDVAHAGASAHQLDGDRHHVLRFVLGHLHELFEERLPLGVVSVLANALQPLDLPLFRGRVVRVELDIELLVLVDVGVDADDGLVRRLLLQGGVVGVIGDVLLEPRLPDELDGPAQPVDLVDDLEDLPLVVAGERLEEVRAPERVDDVSRTGLLGDDLLRAQRDLHRLLRRNGEGLVHAVGV